MSPTVRRTAGVHGREDALVAKGVTWVIQRRVVLADQAEQLRKELAEIEAEVVIGRFIEAERAGEADDPAMHAELERVTASPDAGGMRLIPDRRPG